MCNTREKECKKGKGNRNVKFHNKHCPQYQKYAKTRKRANAWYAKNKKRLTKKRKDARR